MTHWTPARIAEARQRAELAESVTLPVEQFRELLERVPVWMPIESAPRDGTELLIWVDSFGMSLGLWRKLKTKNAKGTGWWDCILGMLENYGDATHWLPLPQPPKESRS